MDQINLARKYNSSAAFDLLKDIIFHLVIDIDVLKKESKLKIIKDAIKFSIKLRFLNKWGIKGAGLLLIYLIKPKYTNKRLVQILRNSGRII